MDKIEIKKHNWDDITITDYKQILDISSKELDSDLEKSISVLAILCECSEDDLYGMNIQELNRLIPEVWIDKPFTFNKNKNWSKIMLNGRKYNVVVDINKFTVAQYADFQIYWDKRDDIDYMGKLLTCFIIPDGCKYNDGYDIVELAQRLENLVSITDYNSICFFFLQDCLLSTKASLLYSNWQLMKMIRKEKDKAKKEKLKNLQKQVLEKISQL